MPIIIGVIAVIAIVGGVIVLNQEDDSTPANNPEEAVVEEQVTEPVTTGSDPDPEPEDDPVSESDTVDNIPSASIELESEVAVDPLPTVVDESEFTNGTYSAETSYLTPRRTSHDMDVSLTIENDIVVAANVIYDDGQETSSSNTRFDAVYKDEVIGKRLDEIELSRVGGASLTSNAFNEAVEDIIDQAS